ncbi:MAG: MerR family transcriptional regulator [Acidimicrobiales bacterium]
MHQIGEVAEAVGLSLRTIRHYEEVGIVTPSGRSSGGFRLYTDQDIDRLRLVKHMKPLGFTLDEIAELLTTNDRLAAGSCNTEEEVQIHERLRHYAEIAEERCRTLRIQLDAAESMVRHLYDAADHHGVTLTTTQLQGIASSTS